MLARNLALEILKSQIGVEEGVLNNTGVRVAEFQRADTYPGVNEPWCVDLGWDWAPRLSTGARRVKKNGKWTLVGGEILAGGTASCSAVIAFAKQRRWIVSGRPFKADKMIFSDGSHFMTIEKVLSIGPFLTVQTIEGNTTSYGALSRTPHNRDGVYRKRRIVRRSSVTIVRVPGEAKARDPLALAALARLTPKPKEKPQPKPAPKPKPKPKPKGPLKVTPGVLRARTGYFAWLAWYLGEGDWKPYGRRNALVRPHVAKKVSASWWPRSRKFLAARKEKR